MERFGAREVPLRTLPKTTEEAERRYLYNYERLYNGPATELIRLKSTTVAFIAKLRKVAPKFYEDKLPTLINQAASKLLTFNTNTPTGADEFNKTHATFLMILLNLQKSQPKDGVNFQEEQERIAERKRLIDRQLEIRGKLNQLEATELDLDELSDEENETTYSRAMTQIENLRKEQRRVAIQIAAMEGLEVEEEPTFELRVTPGTTLSRLTKEQLDNLEHQMLEFYKRNNKEKLSLYVDKSIIDGMLANLNIDESRFQMEELREMSKNALDAYKSYYREMEEKLREEFHTELLTNKELLPKEGLILSGPDDVPDDVKRKLDDNDRAFKRRMEDVVEDFSKKQCPDNEGIADAIGDDDDIPTDDTRNIMESIRQAVRYERVKEEPRDDYESDDVPSGDELAVDGDIAEALVDGRLVSYVSDSEQNMNSNCAQGTTNGYSNGDARHPITEEDDNGHDGDDDDDDDDDDEIECLGTVEPIDKVKTVEFD